MILKLSPSETLRALPRTYKSPTMLPYIACNSAICYETYKGVWI